ncbi:MAG: hypothetical protein V3U06_01285 [Candidatus Binatia bacterium]
MRVSSEALAPGLRSRSGCFGGVGKEDTLRHAAHRRWPTGRRVAPEETLWEGPRLPGLRSRNYFGGVG